MSGCPINAVKLVERSAANPLECQLCHTELVGPVRLSCQHYFCRRCLSSSNECPMCGGATAAADNGELVEDSVLSYLIDSSHERTEICANCDRTVQPMYFCETCQQPLCGQCRALTHKAKIFALHHIAPLEERGRLRCRLVCETHKEPFIVFCQELKKLMCIECFNAASSVKRGNFLNVDLAHKICCDKLEKASARLRLFHDDVMEQIETRRRFVAEIETNFNTHVKELNESFEVLSQLIERLKSTLLVRLSDELAQKQKLVGDELQFLENLKDPIRVNLLSASVFCSYASKIDLLHYFSGLSEAMEQVMAKRIKKLSLSADCRVDFRANLASQLAANFFCSADPLKPADETFLDVTDPKMTSELSCEPAALINDVEMDSIRLAADFGENEAPPAFAKMTGGDASANFRNASANGFRFSSDLNTTFNEQMQQVNSSMIASFEEVSRLSKELVQLQRDITLRRCLVATDNFNRLSTACETLRDDLAGQRTYAQSLQPTFQQVWRQQAQRIRQEQLFYRQKVNELGCVHRFAERVYDSAQQLRPFALYIASVVGVMDGRRTLEVHVSPMEQICRQISSLEPDSHQRIDAIEREEESRRLAKIQQLAVLPEAQQAKRRLKETRTPLNNKAAAHQPVVVVENRSRSSFIPSAKKSKDKTKREHCQIDGLDSCVSPIFFSSPAVSSELEIRCASSLAVFSSTTVSNMSLSPTASLIGEASELPGGAAKSIGDDMDSLLDMEIRSQNNHLLCETALRSDPASRKRECLVVENKAVSVDVQNTNAEEPTKLESRPIGKLNSLSPQIQSIAHMLEGQLKMHEDCTKKPVAAELDVDLPGSKTIGTAKTAGKSGGVKKTEKSDAVLSKSIQPSTIAIGASEATIEARSRLLQSIKERVKRID